MFIIRELIHLLVSITMAAYLFINQYRRDFEVKHRNVDQKYLNSSRENLPK